MSSTAAFSAHGGVEVDTQGDAFRAAWARGKAMTAKEIITFAQAG